jgi:hypothetical protein
MSSASAGRMTGMGEVKMSDDEGICARPALRSGEADGFGSGTI